MNNNYFRKIQLLVGPKYQRSEISFCELKVAVE